ncbi:hypothetical protein J32TS6_36590 [Virgibacillus pantothenticus]|uniref:DUF2812 domain-containing protein n=1 Tax=Virgibacillus pantothenticus TaxID=1473 RepID=UPI00067C3BAD|nr:DUF2812 domain-containing protein [Virgibacillus pantothenticus]MED3737084.1 DUF2812 domain-containing protein [Virgibacillus pantothenticus]QTY16346.1 DUF2812 domain-containing protein [Virgibacillus pantothenticus]GIP65104.1 hypothetical protein J32TS6_36590 [Virgibacillus pantothenticus]SIS68597.1 Protein of unknown function [Virgibacillus pantothenticus]
MKKSFLKKVSKKFSAFTEEEQWLQTMVQNGWILKKYSDEGEGGCSYIFEPIQKKDVIYKIDFREFNRKKDYQEYKDLFEDAGWKLLSKNQSYSKHIFYTSSTNKQSDIFSDAPSYIEREKRKMSASLRDAIIYLVISCICLALRIIFERTSFYGPSGLFLIISIKYVMDYLKHRKTYKSLIGKGNQFKKQPIS